MKKITRTLDYLEVTATITKTDGQKEVITEYLPISDEEKIVKELVKIYGTGCRVVVENTKIFKERSVSLPFNEFIKAGMR